MKHLFLVLLFTPALLLAKGGEENPGMVEVTNFPATQTVDGQVTIGNTIGVDVLSMPFYTVPWVHTFKLEYAEGDYNTQEVCTLFNLPVKLPNYSIVLTLQNINGRMNQGPKIAPKFVVRVTKLPENTHTTYEFAGRPAAGWEDSSEYHHFVQEQFMAPVLDYSIICVKAYSIIPVQDVAHQVPVTLTGVVNYNVSLPSN